MRRSSRRRFLAQTGAATLAGSALLPACGHAAGHRPSAPRARAATAADLDRLTAAARVDFLAVQAYQALLAGANRGQYLSLPPGIPDFWQTLRQHHSTHLDQTNALLTSAHSPAVTEPDPKLAPAVLTFISRARDLAAIGTVALVLETAAAATHQDNAAHLSGTRPTQLAASIAPIEAQHVAMWNLVLARYPGTLDSTGSPQAFTETAQSRAPLA